MEFMTRADVERLRRQHHSYGRHRHVGFGEEEQMSLVRMGGQGIVGLILGFVHGYKAGMPEWKKIPLDGAAAVIFKFLRFIPGTPDWFRTTTDVAADASAVYFLGSVGVTLGQKLREKRGLMATPPGPPSNRVITSGSTPFDMRTSRFQPQVLRNAVAGRT